MYGLGVWGVYGYRGCIGGVWAGCMGYMGIRRVCAGCILIRDLFAILHD